MFLTACIIFPSSIADDAAQCTSEAYVGGYSAERCRTGCGALSQALYKLPVGLLHSADR